jgi:hypothetical protein
MQSATNSSQLGIPSYQGILQGNARVERRAQPRISLKIRGFNEKPGVPRREF